MQSPAKVQLEGLEQLGLSFIPIRCCRLDSTDAEFPQIQAPGFLEPRSESVDNLWFGECGTRLRSDEDARGRRGSVARVSCSPIGGNAESLAACLCLLGFTLRNGNFSIGGNLAGGDANLAGGNFAFWDSHLLAAAPVVLAPVFV